ncbi:ribose-phosphate diphosphokinase [Desulforhabdus amnigena]|uniref:ribose-phosphate diphosphokinase n=1 Tax=Desulforhabdus amnigena TaxID=40218 RepID=UPI0016A89EE4|nr:ribose-phosphate pyrophosphokinase [Desulforhabdus amnigena]NLJ26800.1 ribose-phosphate pyrophosphokinase [Deltaproteobacteria bacterium]
MQSRLVILSGNSNPELTRKVCLNLGVEAAKALIGRFSDGEVRVEIQHNVRGKDVYVVQSTCPPVNENLVELLVMIDALKRASARCINVVIPYYAYGRKDQKDKPRVSITARLVADLLTVAGAHRIITVNLHADQIQGFFNIPVEHLFGTRVLLDAIRKDIRGDEVIVAPDAGGVSRARAFASRLNVDLAIMDSRYQNDVRHSFIVGDVSGRRVIILDDMVDTARTLLRAVEGAEAAGAASIVACVVHPVLSGNAVEKLASSALQALTVTDTVPLSQEATGCEKIRVVSIAPMLAEAIRRVHLEESVSSLFSG